MTTRTHIDPLGPIDPARERRALWALVAAAVLVRIAAVVVLTGGGPIPAGSDALSYDAFARRILAGAWIDRPISYREVGYPAFLAGVYALTGGSLLAGRLANALLGGVVVFLVHRLARRAMPAVPALAATAWAAAYPHAVYFAAFLLRETLVTTLLTGSLAALARAVAGRPARRGAWAGAGAGLWVLLVHTDARYLFHAPVVVAAAAAAAWVVRRGREGRRRAAVVAAVWAVVFAAGMVPWQVRNHRAYGAFVLVNTRTFTWPRDVGRRYEEAGLGRDITPAGGWRMPPRDPAAEARRAPVRRVLRGPRRVLHEVTELFRACRFRGETRNNSTTWEKPWSARHNAVSLLSYGVLLPLFLFGAAAAVRRLDPVVTPLAAVVAAHAVLHAIKWGRPRYRVPIEPLIIVLAFHGAWRLAARRRRAAAAPPADECPEPAGGASGEGTAR